MKKLLTLILILCAFKVSAQTYTLNYDSVRVGKTPTSSVLIPDKVYLKGLPKGNISIRTDGKVIHNDTVYAPKDSAFNINKNLSDVQNKATARANLDIYSKGEALGLFAKTSDTSIFARKIGSANMIQKSYKGYYSSIKSLSQIGDTLKTSNGVYQWFGDSYTDGAGAYPQSTKVFAFRTLVSTTMAITEVNRGRGGSTLQRVTVGDSSMYDRYLAGNVPLPANTNSRLFFEFGTNDFVSDSTIFTVATFTTQYNAIINGFKTAGWTSAQITLSTVGNRLDAPAYNYRRTLYNNAIISIAASQGVNLYNMYSDMVNNGGSALLISDNVHPNNLGHRVIADGLIALLGTNGVATNKTYGNQYVYGSLKVGINVPPTQIPGSGYFTGDVKIDGATTTSGISNLTGGINIGGYFKGKYSFNNTSSVTLGATDYLLQNFYTSGTGTVTLPTPIGNTGRFVIIKNISSQNIAVSGAFAGEAATILPFDAQQYYSDGTNWFATGASQKNYVTLAGTNALSGTYNVSGTINMNSKLLYSVTAIGASTYTALATDNLIQSFYNAGTSTVTLPSATGLTGKIITIKNISSSQNVAVTGAFSGENATILPRQTQQYYSDGTNWFDVLASQKDYAMLSKSNNTLSTTNTFTGQVKRNVILTTASTYTVLTTDYIVNVLYNSGTAVITLPSASGNTGQVVIISNLSSSQSVNVTPIFSGWPATVANNSAITYYSDGTNWFATNQSDNNTHINNGTASQTANFNITGTGRAATSLVTGANTSTSSSIAQMEATSASEVAVGVFQNTNGGAYVDRLTTAARFMSVSGAAGYTQIDFGSAPTLGGTFTRYGRIDTDGRWLFNATTNNSTDLLQANGTILSGIPGTTTGGLKLAGATSGTISILPQVAAGTYNFNLPITVGTAGQVLTSQGGGATPMTWTTPVALSSPNIFSAQQEVRGSNLIISQTSTGSNGGLFFKDIPTGFNVSLLPLGNTRTYSSSWSLPDIPRGTHGALVASTDDIIYRPINQTPLTANYTYTTADYTKQFDCTSGALLANLPPAASVYDSATGTGIIYNIKKMDVSINTLTITPNGAELIDGSATIIIAMKGNVQIQSTGTGWIVL